MKKIMLLLFAIGLVFHLSAQQKNNDSTYMEVDYLQKSKNQKVSGALLTGLGSLGLLITFLSNTGQGMVTILSLGTQTPKHKSYTVPYLLSATALSGGITLLSAASRNERRALAAQVFINMEKTELLTLEGINKKSFPQIGVKIRL